jgi:Uma2 family endonuclease
MYDLPSENPEDPGLPDEFHDLQPQLLSATLRLRQYPPDCLFTGTDLNLYYDVRHLQWYKRPDWFLVLGVPRLYDKVDLRSSYVVWQEGISPFVVVELLSPGTEKEDLGQDQALTRVIDGQQVNSEEGAKTGTLPNSNGLPESTSNDLPEKETPPNKWQVYEQILRVPYYVVFSRYTNQLRLFKLTGGQYQEQVLVSDNPRIWIPELELGLGVWEGEFGGVRRQWLRWFDALGEWVPTDAEQERQQAEQERQRAEQERQRAEQERQRAEQAETQLRQVALNLLQQGMTLAQVAGLTGLSEPEVQALIERI